eukprot:scaffold14619_cov66-Phaeocystis_antarctica.AAC.2
MTDPPQQTSTPGGQSTLRPACPPTTTRQPGRSRPAFSASREVRLSRGGGSRLEKSARNEFGGGEAASTRALRSRLRFSACGRQNRSPESEISRAWPRNAELMPATLE